jgi:protein-tyrosine phosphatase
VNFFLSLFEPKLKVLMVCRANICRSPMAEGVLSHRLRQIGQHRKILVESAGTHATVPGHSPDQRISRVMAENGVTPTKSRARQIQVSDFDRYDRIIAMDCKNLAYLQDISPSAHQDKLCLLMSFATQLAVSEVQDPYYGSIEGFRDVFRHIDQSISGLMTQLLDTRT